MLASMSGSAFLAAYIIFAAALIAAAWGMRRRLDPTSGAPVDEGALGALDPTDLAFMRGGAAGVAELTVMDLVGRGYLTIERYDAAFASQLIVARADDAPPASYLRPHERAVLAALESPRSVGDVTEDADLHAALGSTVEASGRRLDTLGWTLSGEAHTRLLTLDAALIAALFLGVGAKALAGTPDGHEGVGAALVVGLIAGVAIQWRVAPGRLSDLGERALKQLRRMHAPLRARVAREERALADGQLTTLAALFDPSLLAADADRA
jgi:uncharacterized protein (TIGR04222 family)